MHERIRMYCKKLSHYLLRFPPTRVHVVFPVIRLFVEFVLHTNGIAYICVRFSFNLEPRERFCNVFCKKQWEGIVLCTQECTMKTNGIKNLPEFKLIWHVARNRDRGVCSHKDVLKAQHRVALSKKRQKKWSPRGNPEINGCRNRL